MKQNHPLLKKILVAFSLMAFVFSCTTNSSSEKKQKTEITYADSISSILFKNCTPCHRPNQAGPFNLLTYADAKRNANKIKFVTQTHYMPPWPADAGYTHFIDERILSKNEIEQIKTWVDSGCKAGDTSKTIAPVFYDGSFFGKPDVVVKMQEAIPIKGNGTDHFYMIKVPFELKHDTFVRVIEFVPQQRKLAHHVNGHLLNYEDAKKATVFKGKSYYLDIPGGSNDLYKLMGLLNDDGTYPVLTPNVVYYLPGYTPPTYPENMGGYKINKKGSFFLKNMHYGPSTKDCLDSSTINIFYGPKPVRQIQETQLGTFGIAPIEPALNIPANAIKTFMSRWITPADLSILSVNPHMHLLGKTFWAFAITPQNDTIRLIKINKWDFKWQYYYTFKHPLKIPAGSTLYAYGTYDNTDKNPYNPFHPPRDIIERNDFQSMGTTEEMFQFIFTYFRYQTGDEQIDLSKRKSF